MMKYYSDNNALTELLINEGIELVCDENMDVIVSDDDAEKIGVIVERLAPAAINDYCIYDDTEV